MAVIRLHLKSGVPEILLQTMRHPRI